METTLKTDTLDERIFQTRQSWEFLGIYKLDNGCETPKKVKIEIRVNAYDFQSYAHSSIWNAKDEKWSRVADIPYAEMESVSNISYVDKDRTDVERGFEDDIDTLMMLTKLILF